MASYRSTILAESSLVALYPLDAASGTAAADVKGGNTGAYTNASFTLGQAGYGLSGNATKFVPSAYVTAPTTAALEITGNFTIEVLVKLTSTPRTNQFTHIAGKRYSAFTSPWDNYALSAENSTGAFIGGIGIGATNPVINGTTIPVADAWHHLAFTYDGAHLNLYLDGVADAAPVAATGTLRNDAQPFGIAAGLFAGGSDVRNAFPGTLSNVAVYNSALSAGTLLTHVAAINGVDSAGAAPLMIGF